MADPTEKVEAPLLDQLAGQINDLYDRAEQAGDDLRLQMAEKIAEAKNHVPKGQWKSWVEDNLNFSYTYACEMANIGAAQDPAQALRERREQQLEAMRKARQRNTSRDRTTDTHDRVPLPESLSNCASEQDLLKRVEFQKDKGKWYLCVRVTPLKQEPLAEAAA